MARHRILGIFALFACMLLGRPAVAQQTFFGVFFTDANTGTVVGGAGTILRTTNGGATWTPQFSGTTQDLRSVFFTDANTGTVVGVGGTILRTTDGGATWMRQFADTFSPLLSVSFADANTGTAVGELNTILRTTDGGNTWISQLVGTGVYPAMSESPHTLSFGNQIVGSSSVPQTVILSNTGTAPLQFNSIYTTGDFSETTACSSPLAPGTSCSINIVFTPTARYARTGTLVISSTEISQTDTVALSGTGTVAIAQLSPGSLNFGNQCVNTSSATQNVTLLNTGDGPLTVSTVFTTGPYRQTNNCSSSIAPGTGCNIAIVFTPTVRGTVNGTLSITGNQQGTAPVTALVGTGH